MPACPEEKKTNLRLTNGATASRAEREPLSKKSGEAPDVDPQEQEFVPSEGGWGWVVCFASFWTNGTIFGTLNTFGVIYAELMEEFEDSADTNLAFKLCEYKLSICIHLCIYICIYVCTYVCIYICVCMCLNFANIYVLMLSNSIFEIL